MGGGSAPRFAPDDPSLPPPWKALVDGKTGYIYFWNTETNATQYEKPEPVQSIPPPPPGPPPVPPKTATLASEDDQGAKHSSSRNGTLSASVSSKNVVQDNMQSVVSPRASDRYTSKSSKHEFSKFSDSAHGAIDHLNPHSQQHNGHASDYYSRHHRMSADKNGAQLEDRCNKQMIDQQSKVSTEHRVDRHASDDRHHGRCMSDDRHASRHMSEDHLIDSHATRHLQDDHRSVKCSSDNHHAGRYMQDDYRSVKHSSDDHRSSRHGQDYHGMAGETVNASVTDGSWGGAGNRHAQCSPGTSRTISSSKDVRVETRGNVPQRGNVPKLAPIPVPQWQKDSHASPGFTQLSEKPRQVVQSFPLSASFKRTANDYPVGANDLHKRPRLQCVTDSSLVSDVHAYRKQHEISVLGEDVPSPFMSFEAGNFPYEIQRELRNAGFVSPTPIQAQSWPIALQNRDVVAIAKTGSGKTLGYLLPAFLRLLGLRLDSRCGPVVLVLAPTRELATQIEDEAKKFGRSSRITSTCVYGGAPKGPQLRDLEQGADIVIATPGRLNDFLEMNKISLRQVSYLVLDEADRMLDMGFEPQIRKIVKEVPISRQTLMFTATWPREVRKIAADLLVHPVQVNIGNSDELTANKSITQHVEIVTPFFKQKRLEDILHNQEPGSKIIIFCSTKKMCDQLARNLGRSFRVASIHGDKSQAERDHVLGQFKTGRTSILVATDVAARGLDVKDIRVVINYDFPTGVEDYVHRIGRTGRAGATGVAFTFFSEQDAKYAKELVKVLEGADQKVPKELYDFAERSGQLRGRGRWSADEGYSSAGPLSNDINTRGGHVLSVGRDCVVGSRINGTCDEIRGRSSRGNYTGVSATISTPGDGIIGRSGIIHGGVGSESGIFHPREGLRASDGWQKDEHDDDGWGRVNGAHNFVHESRSGIDDDRLWHSLDSNRYAGARHNDWHGEHGTGGRHFARKTGWSDSACNDGFGPPLGSRVCSGFSDKPLERGRVFDRLGDRNRDKVINDRIFTEGYPRQLVPREEGFGPKRGFGIGRGHNWSWGKGWEAGQNHSPSNQFVNRHHRSPARVWGRSCSRSPGRAWGRSRSRSRSPRKGWETTRNRSPGKGWGKSYSPGRRWGRNHSPGKDWSNSRSPGRGWGRSHSPDRGWGRSHSPDRGWGRSAGKGWGRSFSPKKGLGRSPNRIAGKAYRKSRSRSPGKGWGRNHSRSPGKGWGRSRSRSPEKGCGRSRSCSPDDGWGRRSNVSHANPCSNQSSSPKKATLSASGHDPTVEQHKDKVSPGFNLRDSSESKESDKKQQSNEIEASACKTFSETVQLESTTLETEKAACPPGSGVDQKQSAGSCTVVKESNSVVNLDSESWETDANGLKDSSAIPTSNAGNTISNNHEEV